MFGFPDGQIDILKGKIADLKLPYLARQRAKLERESDYLYEEEDENTEYEDAEEILPVILSYNGE